MELAIPTALCFSRERRPYIARTAAITPHTIIVRAIEMRTKSADRQNVLLFRNVLKFCRSMERHNNKHTHTLTLENFNGNNCPKQHARPIQIKISPEWLVIHSCNATAAHTHGKKHHLPG